MTDNYPPGSMPPPQWAESPVPEPPAYGQPPELPEYADSPVAAQRAEENHGTADVVKDQAVDLGHGTVEAGKHAAGVAQEQASAVAANALTGPDYLVLPPRRSIQGDHRRSASLGQRLMRTPALAWCRVCWQSWWVTTAGYPTSREEQHVI